MSRINGRSQSLCDSCSCIRLNKLEAEAVYVLSLPLNKHCFQRFRFRILDNNGANLKTEASIEKVGPYVLVALFRELDYLVFTENSPLNCRNCRLKTSFA